MEADVRNVSPRGEDDGHTKCKGMRPIRYREKKLTANQILRSEAKGQSDTENTLWLIANQILRTAINSQKDTCCHI